MAVEPRHEARPLRVRLRGYLLAVPILAGAAVVAHWWVPESWSASTETALFLLAASVLFGEVRARRFRRVRRMPD
ncbi:hypothetical protein ACF09J_11090 [Streptomyces sp. NPDC014889]|uniref:hypothetical protein n=1 Tax=Streptomyces sp. NPDC014889 TaxID=3364928 RepID=UPI003701CFB8